VARAQAAGQRRSARPRLDDELERARLRRVFDAGLAGVTGYVLPLARGEGDGAGWITGRWFLRDERMYLLPGDSPMGYRLPLDSLPWASRPTIRGSSTRIRSRRARRCRRPPAARAIAGCNVARRRARRGAAAPPAAARRNVAPAAPGARESDQHAIRTALCVEVRHPSRVAGRPSNWPMEDRRGILYVFMPPLTAWRTTWLLAAVEATAAELGVKIVLEGYPPPRDPRLKLLQVTPDPGVIEVNIHPASNWTELVDHTEFLYRPRTNAPVDREVHGRRPPPAPAAATTSCWAAPRRRTARSCAAPTCWPA
jgi:uncharacterized protein (DUF2126 family)